MCRSSSNEHSSGFVLSDVQYCAFWQRIPVYAGSFDLRLRSWPKQTNYTSAFWNVLRTEPYKCRVARDRQARTIFSPTCSWPECSAASGPVESEFMGAVLSKSPNRHAICANGYSHTSARWMFYDRLRLCKMYIWDHPGFSSGYNGSCLTR